MKLYPLVAIIPLLSIGCNRADGDKLARVGWKVTEKVHALIPSRTPFGDALPAGRQSGPEDRVRERFKTDRYLTTAAIEVIAEGGSIRLRGQVNDEVLKRRAVEIAESTVGVEKVVDEIVVVR
jgi:hyperosmotically inducible periplasmic protein